MWSLRLSDAGKKFVRMATGALALCSTEYLLYYHVLPEYTRRKFMGTKLEDKPEYADEVLIDTGSTRFIIRHRGGSTAVASVLRDTYNHWRFFNILGVQFVSALSLCIGHVKQRPLFPLVCLGLITSNLMLVYPELHSCLGLLRLAHVVDQGNRHTWENLAEARYVQKSDQAASTELRLLDFGGLYSSAALCFYCAPVLTAVTSTLLWLYLRSLRSAAAPRTVDTKQATFQP